MADSTTVIDGSSRPETSGRNQSSLTESGSLHFGGQSGALDATNGRKIIINNLSHEFHSDLDDHVVAPVSGAKAVRKVDNHEHMLSDDDCPKVLTTLETVKKPTVPSLSSVEPPAPIEHEEEEGTILLEVCQEDSSTVVVPAEKPVVKQADQAKKQLAEIQLINMKSGARGRPRKYSTIDVEPKKVTAKKLANTYRHSIDSVNFRKERVTKPKPELIAALKRVEIKKGVAAKFAQPLPRVPAAKIISKPGRILNKLENVELTPIVKPVPAQSAGTIEIPRELLLSETEIPASPIILNHVNPGKKLNNDELIAILEGEPEPQGSNVEHFEVSITGDGNLRPVQLNANAAGGLTKDEEREIAMHQMLNLPTKKKGRPRMDPAQKKVPVKTPKKEKVDASPKTSAAKDLVSALVSEWDDNENDSKNGEQETEFVIEISNASNTAKVQAKKRKSIEPIASPTPTFKSSRVIKKKIIWDPDAPETAINYASYAHTSGPGPAKRPVGKKPVAPLTDVAAVEPPSPVERATTRTLNRQSSSPVNSASKKKKTSEIDKLLGDEGAKNMLESLHQDNNNSETVPTKPARKIIKTEPYDSIIHNLPRIRAPRKEVSPKVAAAKQTAAAGIKKEPTTIPKKRGPKAASSSWDYVFSARADDDSMIIRRRSNSSYSSNASPNRLSLDLASAPPVIDNDGADITERDLAEPVKKKSRVSKEKEKVFEFAKPIAKKPIKVEPQPTTSNQSILSDIRGKFNKAISGEAKKLVRAGGDAIADAKKPGKVLNADIVPLNDALKWYSELTVKPHKHCVQLILSPLAAGNGGRYKNLFTVQVKIDRLTSIPSFCSLLVVTFFLFYYFAAHERNIIGFAHLRSR